MDPYSIVELGNDRLRSGDSQTAVRAYRMAAEALAKSDDSFDRRYSDVLFVIAESTEDYALWYGKIVDRYLTTNPGKLVYNHA